MAEEHDLNQILATDSVSEQPQQPVASLAVSAPTAPVTWENLKDYIIRNNDKLANAGIVDISGFNRVPQGKFMLFCTSEAEDADLVLVERPNTLWMNRDIVPESIKVESSGIIIKTNNSRIYIGKNNVTKFDINDSKVVGMSVIGRAKTAESVKVEIETVASSEKPVDEVKLHIKRISPRLYNIIKDMTTKDDIKNAIVTFMNKVYDLNHLIKIERELLLALSL